MRIAGGYAGARTHTLEKGPPVIRPIVTSPLMLRAPGEDADPTDALDAQVGQDLLDTLEAHRHECVGMAANMIGVRKRIIVAVEGTRSLLMYNPEVLEGTGAYETEEGCLSLVGTRKTERWRSIRVQWQNEKLQNRAKTFTGFTAEIIQHEIDHCEGIII